MKKNQVSVPDKMLCRLVDKWIREDEKLDSKYRTAIVIERHNEFEFFVSDRAAMYRIHKIELPETYAKIEKYPHTPKEIGRTYGMADGTCACMFKGYDSQVTWPQVMKTTKVRRSNWHHVTYNEETGKVEEDTVVYQGEDFNCTMNWQYVAPLVGCETWAIPALRGGLLLLMGCRGLVSAAVMSVRLYDENWPQYRPYKAPEKKEAAS